MINEIVEPAHGPYARHDPDRRPNTRSPGRDLLCGDPGGQQQAGQRIGRVNRPLPGGVGVQRQEELPVREGPGQPVRGVHRESGLADPRHPIDRMNAYHSAVGGHAGEGATAHQNATPSVDPAAMTRGMSHG